MADMIPQGTQENGLPQGHESGDANIRAVVGTMATILSSAIVVCLLLTVMFRYLNARENNKYSDMPPMLMQRQVPPKPRILPSPFDEKDDAASGVQPGSERNSAGVNATDKSGRRVDATSDDLLPWDKHRIEAAQAEAQADSYTEDRKTGAVTIPVERAIELTSSGADRFAAQTGHAAIKSSAAPGESGGREGEANSTAGKQSGAEQGGLEQGLPKLYGPIYSESSHWETEDQRLTADSSGGRMSQEKK
jgi:hypothetical protein